MGEADEAVEEGVSWEDCGTGVGWDMVGSVVLQCHCG